MSEITYLTVLPGKDDVSVGSVVVHNSVRATEHLSSRGFRAWLAPASDHRLEVCDCGWAPQVGGHFRIAKKAPSEIV